MTPNDARLYCGNTFPKGDLMEVDTEEKVRLAKQLYFENKGSKSDLTRFFWITLITSYKWRPPSLNELTPMIINMGLTHLGSEASK